MSAPFFFETRVLAQCSLTLHRIALLLIPRRLAVADRAGVRTSLRTCLLLSLLVACRMPEGPAIPPLEDSSTAYWTLELNHRAVTLSTYTPWDTVQLIATPVLMSGDTLDASGTVTRFVSLDSANVHVTPDGVVTARGIASDARIAVTLTRGRLTYFDTVLVNVVDNPSPKRLDSLSIQPPPSDSAKIAIDYLQGWPWGYLTTYASDGSTMDEIVVAWRTLDPELCQVDRSSGIITMSAFPRNGTVRIVASAYAYGIAHVDTLFLQVGYPLFLDAQFHSRPRSDGQGNQTVIHSDWLAPARGLNPDDPILVGVGAQLYLVNYTFEDVDLVFDDTAHVDAFGEPVNGVLRGCDAVNDPQCRLPGDAWRMFTAPGDYTFRDARTNVSGTIRVVDERLAAVAQRVRPIARQSQ